MAQGPLEKAIGRRQDLLRKNADLRAEIEKNNGEISEIDVALAIMRNYAPLGQLPGLDEDVRSVYGNLASMTVPDGIATILRKRGEPLPVRELVDLLERTGKMTLGGKNNSINVIQVLNRFPKRFKKAEDRRGKTTWTLAQANGHLPGLELIEEKLSG